jgi:hypothetical protein
MLLANKFVATKKRDQTGMYKYMPARAFSCACFFIQNHCAKTSAEEM